MIWIFLALGATASIWLVAKSVNVWVQAHALAELVDEKWSIVDIGWGALWPAVSAGAMGGLAAGLVVGLVASGGLANALWALATALSKTKDSALDASRAELLKDRSAINQKIIRSTWESNEKEAAAVQKSSEYYKNLLLLERKLKIMEGKLTGARQKAARLKKNNSTTEEAS